MTRSSGIKADMDSSHPLLQVDEHGLTDARLQEAALLRLCADLASSSSGSLPTCREAQVVRLAAQLVRSSHPQASVRLQRAYEAHQCERHCESYSVTTALERGWVLGLARFRDMLSRQLNGTTSV